MYGYWNTVHTVPALILQRWVGRGWRESEPWGPQLGATCRPRPCRWEWVISCKPPPPLHPASHFLPGPSVPQHFSGCELHSFFWELSWRMRKMIDPLKFVAFSLIEAHFLPEAPWKLPGDYQFLLDPGDMFMAGGNGPTSLEDLPRGLFSGLLDWWVRNPLTLGRNELLSKNQAHLIQI